VNTEVNKKMIELGNKWLSLEKRYAIKSNLKKDPFPKKHFNNYVIYKYSWIPEESYFYVIGHDYIAVAVTLAEEYNARGVDAIAVGDFPFEIVYSGDKNVKK
jgi:hypothetical protein